MNIGGARGAHFLAEWYRRSPSEEPLDDCVAPFARCAGYPVRLIVTLAVTHRRDCFGAFDSTAGEAVGEVCVQAGVPA